MSLLWCENDKNQFAPKEEVFYDDLIDKTVTRAMEVPVFKIYKYEGKRYEEKLNQEDFEIIKKIEKFL